MDGYSEQRTKEHLAERLVKAVVYSVADKGFGLVKTSLEIEVQNTTYIVTIQPKKE